MTAEQIFERSSALRNFRNHLSCYYLVLSQKLFCELRRLVKIPVLLSSARRSRPFSIFVLPIFFTSLSLVWAKYRADTQEVHGCSCFFSNVTAYLMSEAWSTYTSQHPSSASRNRPLRATISRRVEGPPRFQIFFEPVPILATHYAQKTLMTS